MLSGAMTDLWDPTQYERYRALRERPLLDLIDLAVTRLTAERPTVVDLGAGTGRGALSLHRRVGAARTLAVDSSEAMVRQARTHVEGEVEVRQQSIEAFVDDEAQHGAWNLVFSNAALHWLWDHDALLPRLVRLLRAGGVLAVQVPANEQHAAHAVARAVAQRRPFVEALDGWTRNSPVQPPAWYAERLHALGLEEITVQLRLYPQVVAGVEGVVAWVRGSLLTAYQARLPEALFETFVERYTTALAAALGVAPDDPAPLFFPYERLFFAGRRP